MLEVYTAFANLEADEIGPPAPPGSTIDPRTGSTIVPTVSVPAPAGAASTWTPTQIADMARSIYGIVDTPKARAFELKMATLNAQGQQALLNAEMSKQKSWSTVWTIGAIAAAGIIGLVVWSALRKKK